VTQKNMGYFTQWLSVTHSTAEAAYTARGAISVPNL